MKKKILSLQLVILLLLSLAGCGTKNAAEQNQGSSKDGAELTGEITLVSLPDYHDSMMAVIQAFEEAYPGITVNCEEYPYAEIFDAIEVKLGSKSTDFDVLMVDAPVVGGYVYKGYIAPMDAYFSEEEIGQFTTALAQSSSCDGQFYAPPLKNSSMVLWYNKDLLDSADIPYPSEDPNERLTWEQIVDYSQKIMAANSDNPAIYGLTFQQLSRPYQILPLIESKGGKVFGDDALTTTGYLNSTATEEALQWYQDIHNRYGISPKGIAVSETTGQFQAGNIAFLVGNIYAFKQLEETEGLNYGYAPFPYFEGGVPATPTDSFHVGISNYSENKDLAALFVKYLTLGEGNDIFMDLQGEFAARINVLESYDSDEKYQAFPWSAMKLGAYEAINTAAPRPVSTGYREFEALVEPCFEDIRNGADVNESLTNAAKQIDEQLIAYQ